MDTSAVQEPLASLASSVAVKPPSVNPIGLVGIIFRVGIDL